MKNHSSRFTRWLTHLACITPIAAALLGAAGAQGALIPGLYGTGVETNGALLGNAQVDPHFKIIVSPDAGAPGPNAYTLNPGFPVGPWIAEGPNSRWIGPSPDQSAGNAVGNYTYRITFDLTGFTPSSAKIEGSWTSDNGGTAILLNGVSTGLSQGGNFGELTSFLIDTGFVAGTNTLDFVVNNADGGTGAPGPTGLRVNLVGTVQVPGEPPAIASQPVSQRAIVGDTVTFSVAAIGTDLSYRWRFNSNDIAGADQTNLVLTGVTIDQTGFYDVVVANFDGETNTVPALLVVSLPIPGVFNTGVGNDGVPLADDTIDPHYSLVVNPDSASPNAIVQNSTIFPIVAGPWLASSTNSKWIGPRLDTSGAAGGQYTYRLQFDLTGFDAATAYLVGDWTSDNQGLDMVLNGISKGISQGGSFGSLSGFTITNGFISGINTLDIRVNNDGGGYTGLRVQNFRGGALLSTSGAVPPSILTQPSSIVALTGESATFSVLADGTPPLRYQWYRNAALLQDATNQALTLSNVTTNSSASFYVAVSNDQGTSNSLTVTLTVLPPIPGLFNTGVDNNGALIPDNSPDQHFFLVVNPNTNAPPLAAVSYGGWPVAPAGPYLANGPSSKWLFPPGNDGTNSAHGLHVFATQFDLTGLDPNTALIRGQWGADDNVLDVVLNGRSLGLQCLSGFGSLAPFSITNGFVGGVNSIAFICNNGGDGFGQNPLGFRVELRGTAQPTTCIWPNPTLVRSSPSQSSQEVTVVLPPGLNQSAAVEVTVTSANPAVAEPAGATAGSLTINFPAGGSSSRAFTVNAKTLGSTVFSLSSPAAACIGTNITVTVGETIVANPSFEDNYNAAFPHYTAINNWPQLKPGGTGVNDSSGPFWDNGNNPDRTRVAFAQGTGGIFQEVWGLIPGRSYWLQFSGNVRNCCGGNMGLTVRLNGKELANFASIPAVGSGNPFYSVAGPFTATAEYGLLEFATLAAGDATLVMDAVSIVQRNDNDIPMFNPSFEASGIPAWPGYIYPGPVAGWTMTGEYGVNRSGEGPFADNGTAQDQRNVLLLQHATSSASQVINGLTAGSVYTLSYAFNARGGNTPRLRTTLDGVVVHEQDVTPVGGVAPYYSTNIQFTATGSSVTLAFTQTAADDQTVLIDNVRITGLPPALKITREAGGQVRLAWPISASGYTLRSSVVVNGIYTDTGLVVTVEGDENVSYDIVVPGNKFYQLAR